MLFRSDAFGVRIVARLGLIALLGASNAAGVAAQDIEAPICAPDHALLYQDTKLRASFRVELAKTHESRARGLMYRTELAENAGMLFVFEEPRKAAFWMKNTPLPLDILFFDEHGVLRHIHRNAKPFDLTPIPGAAPHDPQPERLVVLEIAAGEAARHGLHEGLLLAHPDIPQQNAALPCETSLYAPAASGY